MVKSRYMSLIALSVITAHVFVVAQQACQVTTVNILAEKFYHTYYHTQAPRADKMAWRVRKELLGAGLQKVINQAAASNNNFVIAVQECDSQMALVLQKLLVPAGSRVLASPNSRLGFIVGGNWTLAGYEDYCKHDEKRFSVMRLTLTDPEKPGVQETMNIVNVHFYGGDGPDNDYRLYRQSQMKHIADHIRTTQRTKNSKQHWVICGDFNTDSRTNLDAYRDLLEVVNRSGVHFVDALTSDPTTRVSAYCRAAIENLDYMFVSSGLQVAGTRMNPAKDHALRLLTHGYGTTDVVPDKDRHYFSDHCALGVVLAPARLNR